MKTAFVAWALGRKAVNKNRNVHKPLNSLIAYVTPLIKHNMNMKGCDELYNFVIELYISYSYEFSKPFLRMTIHGFIFYEKHEIQRDGLFSHGRVRVVGVCMQRNPEKTKQ